MSEKRKRGHEEGREERAKTKKAKRGFVVGPDNLPDGPLKRKNKKIKRDLIGSAQIKKNYAKLKQQGKIPDEPQRAPQPSSIGPDAKEDQQANAEPASTTPHPDRQELIDREDHSPEPVARQPSTKPERRKKKPKSTPYQKEYEQAQQWKAEAEERRKAREEAERQRQRKIEERERFRKAMSKARGGGQNGQRKLGRESKVLLEKVKRMVGDGV